MNEQPMRNTVKCLEKSKYNMSTCPDPSKMELISWKTVTSCDEFDPWFEETQY